MYIQVLNFRLSRVDRDDASKFVQCAILGVGEFEGYVSDTCQAKPGNPLHGGMIAWANRAALDRFRHSELYAKLLMSPSVDDMSDRAFAIGEDATSAELPAELLAVA